MVLRFLIWRPQPLTNIKTNATNRHLHSLLQRRYEARHWTDARNVGPIDVPGHDSIWTCRLTCIRNPIMEIMRFCDIISTMGIILPFRRHLYIDSTPWLWRKSLFHKWSSSLLDNKNSENNFITSNTGLKASYIFPKSLTALSMQLISWCI